MNESIHFPESKIPDIVRIIRRGLRGEKQGEVTRNLERQCKELDAYYQRLMSEDEESDTEEPPMFHTER